MRPKNRGEIRRELKKENNVHKTSTGLGAAKEGAGPKLEVLKSAVKNYCFIRDTLFNDLQEECELDVGFLLTENMNLSLVCPSYKARSARGQSGCAHKGLLKKDLETAARLRGSFMAFEAHERTLCSDLDFSHCRGGCGQRQGRRCGKKAGGREREGVGGA